MTDIKPQIAKLAFTDSEDAKLVAHTLVQQWKSSNQSSVIHYMYYASYVLLHKNRSLLNDYLLANHL